jgi:hypothetical protein
MRINNLKQRFEQIKNLTNKTDSKNNINLDVCSFELFWFVFFFSRHKVEEN